jgi:peptidoglycan/LPS O-acetylase OafA/YrhL
MGERLYGLDALRGMAAVVVVGLHLGLPIDGAHLAVDFFFVLSGYVMARTYEDRLRSGATGRWQFLRARYRRLWGWMALGTSVGLGVTLAVDGFSASLPAAFGLMLLMLPAVVLPATPYLFNPPLWSVFYELLANAAHALVLSRLGRVPLGLLALACAIGLAETTAQAGFPEAGLSANHLLVLWRVGLAYVLGILLWRLMGDRSLLRVPFSVALATLPLYVLLVWIRPWDMAPLAFILILAPLMMAGGIGARLEAGWARDLAGMAGAWSFPVYALHYPLMALLQLQWGLAAFIVLGGGLWWWLSHRARRRGRMSRLPATI